VASDSIVTTIPEAGSLADLLGEPPSPKDARKYACLDIGYHHKAVPIGMTKRQAFCARCEATYCYFHPELTPKEVKRRKVIPSRYPARPIKNYAEGK
jgi:hypothetical protein